MEDSATKEKILSPQQIQSNVNAKILEQVAKKRASLKQETVTQDNSPMKTGNSPINNGALEQLNIAHEKAKGELQEKHSKQLQSPNLSKEKIAEIWKQYDTELLQLYNGYQSLLAKINELAIERQQQ